MNGNKPSIPTTRIHKTTVRPTRASLARANTVQAKQQQQQNNTTNGQRSSLPSRVKKPSTETSTHHMNKKTANSSTTAIRPTKKSRPDNMNNHTSSSTIGNKRKSITTKESIKKRPAWDMRGKISDLEAQLEKSNDKLKGLYKFKDELHVMKEDKESERKQAIQKAVALKAELQTLEREHEQEIENLNAQQRIHHQELQDKQLIYKRRVTTIEIELQDAQRKLKDAEKRSDQVMQEYQQLEAKLSQAKTETMEMETSLKRIDLKLERFGGTLSDRERDITLQKKTLAKEQPATKTAEEKLQEAQSNRERIQAMINDLQHSS
ncbi:uncharacterized protein BX664DRAFT_315933 [Halteromyces radiatus]|uniref:uncharacterized protein n=1 Tax=Halteromyces radiatus TaxID=101107 RepID=UPI00221FCB11|nr:uncharacterized protein BX664DRAFT_315933 [Halteromyces radiatus]KAI8086768.1 hypothetical protein BX664DRAFT_315933 [Halteromyces radiatus]